jgi:membrane-bound lytic murein transglycosylase B
MLAVVCPAASSVHPGYSQHPSAEAFIERMVSEHQFDHEALEELFGQVEFRQPIIDLMDRPAEKVKPWKDYRLIFITHQRIAAGVDFWREHRSALERAQADYGVDPAVIVAIIGVETFYGRNKGSFRVIDALATLAFDYPKRSPFFTKELEQFLLLSREQKRDPLALTGSYAGAMGFGQFMPSSYRNYAVDYNGDTEVDIWNNPVDAIGSVANYFARHGWQPGQLPVVRAVAAPNYNAGLVNQLVPPTLALDELKAQGFTPVEAGLPPETKAIPIELEAESGPEFWLGLQNFYTITRYNNSHRYAMAINELSQAIAGEMHSASP